MPNRKNHLIAILLFLIPLTVTAGSSVWDKSYQLAMKGNYSEAADVLEPMVRKGNDEYALLRVAYLNYLQGNYSDAVSMYERAVRLNPESIDAKLGITLPLMAQQRWRQVKHYTLQVLRLSHWNYVAHVRLMIAEQGMKKWQELAKHARQLAVAYPSDATVLVYLARAYAWQGNVQAAKVAYEKVLVRIPGHIEAKRYIKDHVRP